jgi:hypothetical protein
VPPPNASRPSALTVMIRSGGVSQVFDIWCIPTERHPRIPRVAGQCLLTPRSPLTATKAYRETEDEVQKRWAGANLRPADEVRLASDGVAGGRFM